MARQIRQAAFEKEDFQPQDLIEKWTRSVALQEEKQNQGNQNARGFVPRPYLLKFENAIEQIRGLRDEIDEQIIKETAISKDDEAQYKSKLSGFMTDLHDIMRAFRSLDGGISKVSRTAIRIGDRLENVEDQRLQILESEELIRHFLRFNKDQAFRDIDPIFDAESGDDLYTAARLIIKLDDIGNDLTLPETQNAREAISKIAIRIKADLKNEFITAYKAKREDNHKDMKECATILAEFNDKKAFEEFLNLYLRDVDLDAYPASDLKQVKVSMEQLRKDLSRVVENALKSIHRVFPEPESVIRDLIHKVFGELLLRFLRKATQPILGAHQGDSKQNDSSQLRVHGGGGGGGSHRVQFSQGMQGHDDYSPKVSMHSMSHSQSEVNNVPNEDHDVLVNRLSKKELDEYLKMTHIVYLESHGLLEKLKGFVREIVFKMGGNDDVERQEKEYSVRHIVEEDKLMSLVFEGHQKRYLKLEKKHLRNTLRDVMREHVIEPLQLGGGPGDLLSDDREEFEMSPSLGSKASPSHMMMMMNDGMADIAITNLQQQRSDDIDSSRSYSSVKKGPNFRKMKDKLTNYTLQQKERLNRMVPKDRKEREDMMGRLRGVFQFGINECVATMKKQVSNSLTRCKNISAAKELSENIHQLFVVYLKAIELLFRDRLIPLCKATLSTTKQQMTIEHWYFLEAVHHTNSALQLVEQCWLNDVSLSITENFDFQKCKHDKERVYRGFEEDILSGLRQLLEVGLGVLKTILKEQQKKSDFKPKQDDIRNFSPTKAATMACAFIDRFQSQTRICLDGRNLDRFFLCLGRRLYYIVVDHFKDKKYEYNQAGAQILTLDAQKYQATAKQFRIERINELFLTLVERTMLMSIHPDSIKTLIESDAKLSKIEKKELQKWLSRRHDYKSAKIEQKLFE